MHFAILFFTVVIGNTKGFPIAENDDADSDFIFLTVPAAVQRDVAIFKGRENDSQSIPTTANRKRNRRDFMLASVNSSRSTTANSAAGDASCFQKCNNAWKQELESRFEIKASDFYDFPFHPKILDYAKFVAYCEMADRQTKCFMDQCGDESAERVFSPSNFLCNFKRNQFVRARTCFEESEPLTFLKCDQHCHSRAVAATTTTIVTTPATVPTITLVSPLASRSIEPSSTTESASAHLNAASNYDSTAILVGTAGASSKTDHNTNNKSTIVAKSNITTTYRNNIVTTMMTASQKTTTTTTAKPETTNVTPTTQQATIIVRANTTPDENVETPLATVAIGAVDRNELGKAKTRRRRDNADSSGSSRAQMGKVFVGAELDHYERELDLLCSFQECYKQCHESIIREICSPALADAALDLVTSFVNWHAADIHDWHVVTQNADRLPTSCARLAYTAMSAAESTNSAHAQSGLLPAS